MALRAALTLLLLTVCLHAQIPLGDHPVPHFEVHAEPRLTALARLGSMTNTSLLIEAGNMAFFNVPIDLTLTDTTIVDVITHILSGPTTYTVRQDGALLILSTPTAPNRLAFLQLGPITYQDGSLPSLIPMLGFYLERATGCNPQRYGYSGQLYELDIPPFQLPDATFEQVAAQVARASEPTFWIMAPAPQLAGCLEDTMATWEVGLYGFGRVWNGYSDPDATFRALMGAELTPPRKPALPQNAPAAGPIFP